MALTQSPLSSTSRYVIYHKAVTFFILFNTGDVTVIFYYLTILFMELFLSRGGTYA